LRSDDTELARFAVQFVDTAESDLTLRSAADFPASEVADRAAGAGVVRGAVEGRLLALLLLLAVVVDWFVLRGRR
jgi:hypothetical protein